MSTPANSYMITNREDPTSVFTPQTPLAGDTLWWYMSTSGTNDTDFSNYSSQSATSSTLPPSSFLDPLTKQLAAQANPSLTLFIHGLDCDWSNAVKYTGIFGANLNAAGYDGLVVGFSWPSMGSADLFNYSNGYPPTAESGTARGNILLSVASFGSLMTWLRDLASAVQGLQVNVACHSEGNYMLMCGMDPLTAGGPDQVIMIAADINDAAFLTPVSGLAGQGAAIAQGSSRVTVYSSTNDTTLQDSITYYGSYHNPTYPGRLGLSGPDYADGTQQSAMVGVDCSQVVNQAYINALPPGTVPVDIHLSYLYIPQVLADFVQTLNGASAGDVANRTATSNTNAYVMEPLPGA